MSIYEKGRGDLNGGELTQSEVHLYGSSRLGIVNTKRNVEHPFVAVNGINTFERGNKFFELSNHLGNVLVTVSDRKLALDTDNDGMIDYYVADVITATDYYPFGMQMPERNYNVEDYSYGFNGKEKDNTIGDDSYDFGARVYYGRIGRWLSLDPLQSKYPSLTPYNYAGNSPIKCYDPDGKVIIIHYIDSKGKPASLKYTPGIKPANSNAFVQQVHEAVKAAMKNDANKTFQAISKSNEVVRIKETSTMDDMTTYAINYTGTKAENVQIAWNPLMAIRLTDGGAISPATALLHEAANALRIISADTKEEVDALKKDKGSVLLSTLLFYDSDEERRVIDEIETPYINNTNKNEPLKRKNEMQGTGEDHRGTGYTSKGVNTIEPANEKDKTNLEKQSDINFVPPSRIDNTRIKTTPGI